MKQKQPPAYYEGMLRSHKLEFDESIGRYERP
jgi:hypothetical protein